LKFLVRDTLAITKHRVTNIDLLVAESEFSVFKLWLQILLNRCIQLTSH